MEVYARMAVWPLALGREARDDIAFIGNAGVVDEVGFFELLESLHETFRPDAVGGKGEILYGAIQLAAGRQKERKQSR